MTAPKVAGRAWTPAELRELELELEAHAGALYPGVYAAVAARQGRTPRSVENAARRIRERARSGAAPLALADATVARVVLERELDAGEPVAVLAPDETAPETPAAFWARAAARTRRACAVAETERRATLRIVTDKPIALGLTSDWHVSTTTATDLDGLLAVAETFAGTPGAYALGVGDMTDNPIKHRPASPRDVPDDLRALDYLLAAWRGRLLGMTSGNHDDWSFAFAGLDSLRTMAERHRIHYAPDEIVYVVEIVDPRDRETVTARWIVATRHKFRRHSALNVTHACWRWLEDMGNEWPTDLEGRTLLPDVLAIGDNHVAAVETRSFPRGDVVAARMGSFQRGSGFARAFGFARYRPTVPTVILHPTRAVGPIAFADYRRALEHLQAARELAAIGAARVRRPDPDADTIVDDGAAG